MMGSLLGHVVRPLTDVVSLRRNHEGLPAHRRQFGRRDHYRKLAVQLAVPEAVREHPYVAAAGILEASVRDEELGFATRFEIFPARHRVTGRHTDPSRSTPAVPAYSSPLRIQPDTVMDVPQLVNACCGAVGLGNSTYPISRTFVVSGQVQRLACSAAGHLHATDDYVHEPARAVRRVVRQCDQARDCQDHSNDQHRAAHVFKIPTGWHLANPTRQAPARLVVEHRGNARPVVCRGKSCPCSQATRPSGLSKPKSNARSCRAMHVCAVPTSESTANSNGRRKPLNNSRSRLAARCGLRPMKSQASVRPPTNPCWRSSIKSSPVDLGNPTIGPHALDTSAVKCRGPA